MDVICESYPDLSQRSMVDVFFDLGDLTTLYPNTNKEELRKFCSAAAPGQSAQSANGYVRHTLVTHVEGSVQCVFCL